MRDDVQAVQVLLYKQLEAKLLASNQSQACICCDSVGRRFGVECKKAALLYRRNFEIESALKARFASLQTPERSVNKDIY